MFKQLFFRRAIARTAQAAAAGPSPGTPIPPSLAETLAAVRTALHSPNDLIVREFTVGSAACPFALFCIDGMVDAALINEQVLKPLIHYCAADEDGVRLLETVEREVLTAFELDHVTTLDDGLLAVLSGDTLLVADGADCGLVVGSRGWKTRALEEPQTESIIRGPRIGFTEDLRTNTSLLRRRIRDVNLCFDIQRIGRRARREVMIAYIDGVVHPALVPELKRRLDTIDIDDVEGSGYVEQWIADSFLTPFPLVLNTERPDKVSGALLQGRVAVLVDGDPFALVLPITLSSCFQSPEDYYQHWLISTLTRILRLMAAFMATFLPSLYIALLEFHHGMIPSRLAFSIAGAREGVPFPAVIEAFMMEITLELLREAGLRLPKPIGQTIGIVGGLVIGEAAVAAGIVSPIMVIVVAVTAIASFALPSYSFAISLRILRFGIMLAASVMGLFGVIMAYVMINVHLVNLKSFGIPYSTPFAPFFAKDWKDLILRAPVMFMNSRPRLTQSPDQKRISQTKKR
ncbi:spore germination protein [Paenibacillus athensensis]|uniref:Spore germination protein n=1 Tax=Paenibacillus athensensis TaxID=1967502 RepID=A0A4Y8Q567_9BACL|nr:spore germination protein [Paenibacillus athensensis]MCD1258468.1 spore germination protein [Paenibacillus athensensis]